MKKTKLFKNLINKDDILKMVCTHDALSSKIAEQIGFESFCLGGYGASASHLGKPDIGLLTLTEMVEHITRVCDGVDIQVFTDADTGHGNTINESGTVKAFEKVGSVGLFIEGQIFPKGRGHMEGKDVIPKEEMVSKIKAALDARNDPDFVIMGRTDALAVNGIDDAIERGILMQEAGADLIFVEAPTSIEDMEAINKYIKGPTFSVYLAGGKNPLYRQRNLKNWGLTSWHKDVPAYMPQAIP